MVALSSYEEDAATLMRQAKEVSLSPRMFIAVGATDAMPPAKESLDVSGMHILPGAIDVHVERRFSSRCNTS